MEILTLNGDGNGSCDLLRNNHDQMNKKPSPPYNFEIKREGTKTILCWDRGSDAETPAKGLKYNIRIGTGPGLADIMCPHVDTSSGVLRIPELVNCKDTFKVLDNLPAGTYYYSVQAIDFMFAGSDFSQEQSFEIKEPFDKMNIGVDIFSSAGSISNGDYDKDGDYDFVVTGTIGTTFYTNIINNNGDSTFNKLDANLLGVYGDAKWGDYDNDNDLDLLRIGEDVSYGEYKLIIYRNDGAGVFTNIYSCVDGSCGRWIDYDNDGDLDIIAMNKLIRNNGNDSFEEDGNFIYEWVFDIAVADFDKDNDQDVLINTEKSKVLLFFNENGNFTQTNHAFANMRGSLNWIDYNNDDYLDLIITGVDTSFIKRTLIYINDKEGGFDEFEPDIRAFVEGELICGDYNEDGFDDVAIGGRSDDNLFKIFESDANDDYFNIYSYIDFETDIYNHQIDWIDYNNDMHLDIVTNYNVLYSNNSTAEKEIPVPPINLRSLNSGFDINFSWDKPKPESHYSYNLRVGTSSGGTEIVSPMADVTTGKRLILKMGNVQLNTTWLIKNLTPGQTYYWSVQSIDKSFVGGAWAAEQYFVLNVVWADFLADTVCFGDTTHFTDLSLYGVNEINSWKWYFGDGDSAMVQHPEHLYTQSGSYPVTLIVSDGEYTDSITKNIIVKSKPIANFQADAVCHGEPTVFVNQTDEQGLNISSWNWEFDDNQTSNQQNPDPHYYAQSGEYNVRLSVTSDNGCLDTISKTAVVAQYPVVIVTADGPIEFCEGDNVLLSVAENANYLYQWKLDDVPLSDSVNYHCNAIYKGAYTVDVENSLAGCLSNSLPVNVNVVEKPVKPIINTSGFHEDNCPGNELITLEVKDATTLYQYQWKKNGIPLEDGVSSTYEDYLEEGNYIVDVANGDCKATSDEVAVFFNKVLPQKPELIAVGPNVWYLACSNDEAQQYEWYYNNEIISGANDYMYVANQDLGTYFVRIAEENGCFVSSDAVTIPLTATGIDNLDPFANLKIYPNPTPGVFTIEMDNQIYGELITRIFSQNVVEIFNIKFDKSTQHFKAQVDLSGQGNGVYIVSLVIGKYKADRKLVVE